MTTKEFFYPLVDEFILWDGIALAIAALAPVAVPFVPNVVAIVLIIVGWGAIVAVAHCAMVAWNHRHGRYLNDEDSPDTPSRATTMSRTPEFTYPVDEQTNPY